MLFARNTPGGEAVVAAVTEAVNRRFPEIRVTASTWNNLELNIADANKGNALRRFAEHLGLTLDNCMSMGDGLNDLTMIEAAGLGVAMANAHPAVTAVADCVTLSNDENGVAKAIRDFVL
jgi:Cof subfamily protein (haloacid dehalogenase superfamily)